MVADFGLSCRFPRRGEKLPQVGTTYFMSPECLKEEYYDEKVRELVHYLGIVFRKRKARQPYGMCQAFYPTVVV